MVPGALSITWPGHSATDDGAGSLTGDASGSVNYSAGTVLLSPNVLPPAGTVFTVVTDDRTQGVAMGVLLAGGSLGAVNITPQSVSFPIFLSITYNTPTSHKPVFRLRQVVLQVVDIAGNL